MRIYKTVLIFAVGATIAIISFLAARTFTKNADNLRDQISESRRLLSGREQPLRKMVDTAEGRHRIMHFLSNNLAYHDHQPDNANVKSPWWHLDVFLWKIHLRVSFDEDEIFYLWCAYAPYQDGAGIWNAALYYYKKPINSLSTRELASLVVAARSPSIYRPGSERSQERVASLMESLDLTNL